MESIIIRTTYDAKCLYSPLLREQLGGMTGAGLSRSEAIEGSQLRIHAEISIQRNEEGTLTQKLSQCAQCIGAQTSL